jgi:hypothetical protein
LLNSSRMRALGLLTLILAAAGCAASDPPAANDADAGDAPPRIKRPPTPKDGAGTAPECDGVTERGSCADGTAVACVLDGDHGELRRKDCRALGKSCIEDSDRGAMCETIAGGPDGAGCGDVTFEGRCEDSTAIWCSEDTIHRWSCAGSVDSEGAPLACEVNAVLGAYCLGAAAAEPDPQPSTHCPAVGFGGICSGDDTTGDGIGDTVIYCLGDADEIETQVTCNEGGHADQGCEVRAGNAWCYTPTIGPLTECDTIGFKGVCEDARTPRWCQNGEIKIDTCEGTEVCRTADDPGACASAATCCEP